MSLLITSQATTQWKLPKGTNVVNQQRLIALPPLPSEGLAPLGTHTTRFSIPVFRCFSFRVKRQWLVFLGLLELAQSFNWSFKNILWVFYMSHTVLGAIDTISIKTSFLISGSFIYRLSSRYREVNGHIYYGFGGGTHRKISNPPLKEWREIFPKKRYLCWALKNR